MIPSLRRFFQLLTIGWKPKTPFDVVTTVAAVAMGAILFVQIFGQSIWHWTSGEFADIGTLAMTAMGICMLSIALTGFMLWPSIDRPNRGLSIMLLGFGIYGVSSITALGHGPGAPDFAPWFRIRAGALVFFAATLAGDAVYMVRTRTSARQQEARFK